MIYFKKLNYYKNVCSDFFFLQILEEVSIHQGMLEDAEFIAGQCVNLAQADR